MNKRWIGPPPTHCDICHKPIMDTYYDAALKLKQRRIWANLYPTCFEVGGGKLGPGSGQKYVWNPVEGIYFKRGG
jgi:hypothetical protein